MNKEILTYIQQLIKLRLESNGADVILPTYKFSKNQSVFADLILQMEIGTDETIVMLLAMLPSVDPSFLNGILSDTYPDGANAEIFGGVKGNQFRGVIPTGETAQFIIGGKNLVKRTAVAKLFHEEHFFYKQHLLTLGEVENGEPKMSGKLLLDQDFIDFVLYGYVTKPKLSNDFPAELLTSNLTWDDLVLNSKTKSDINDILMWLNHHETLMSDFEMENKVKPGYRVLFHGPPGVGKSLTASLLGKQTNLDVYRVDLSMVISKFIGETEKNLAKLFDKAQHKNWILFFDEADAIFGKRTGVRDAHDKYANQEVSYLLQRIENYAGLVILASNYKSNIDKAFTRRFQAMVAFENPGKKEQKMLWERYVPQNLLNSDVDIQEIINTYDLTGANMVNVAQHAGLMAIQQNHKKITKTILIDAIKREYLKEGRMM
jgi:AAA+ superfamily predicted ATPase